MRYGVLHIGCGGPVSAGRGTSTGDLRFENKIRFGYFRVGGGGVNWVMTVAEVQGFFLRHQ